MKLALEARRYAFPPCISSDDSHFFLVVLLVAIPPKSDRRSGAFVQPVVRSEIAKRPTFA